LIIPGGANITTAAGDRFRAYSLGSGNWVVQFYQRANGFAVVGYGPGGTDVAITDGGTGASTAAAAVDNLATAEASVASAATVNLGAQTSQRVSITGTTTITSFGTANAGIWREGRFAGALTLTHNGTSLILPGAANITTAANDRFRAYSLGSGNWLVTDYTRASGAALIGYIPGGTDVAVSDGGTGSSTATGGFDNLTSASEASVASASTTDIGAAASHIVNITGTTTITGFGTSPVGKVRWGRFAGVLTLTHNATSLILPNNGNNITTAAGDRFSAVSLGSGNWYVLDYVRANGQALQGVQGAAGSSGQLQFNSGGTLAGATGVTTDGAGNVVITGNLEVQGNLIGSGDGPAEFNRAVVFAGILSPAQLTANQNDYNPTGLSTNSALRLTSDASRNITGIVGRDNGGLLRIVNVGANPIVLQNENAGSVATNRLSLGADITLVANESFKLL
jgi:hypothetical protein